VTDGCADFFGFFAAVFLGDPDFFPAFFAIGYSIRINKFPAS
jgi:hypothetical protein